MMMDNQLPAHNRNLNNNDKLNIVEKLAREMRVLDGEGSSPGRIYDMYVFTRDSIYAIARICYRPSVCPSHGWIIQKWLKLGL